ITAVVRATASTTLLTSKRDLKNYWYVSVECGSQMVGTAVSVALAFMLRSVAALAWGWIASGIAYTILSHFAPGARHNWFRWDRDAVHSLVTFGRWAMASSGVTILQERGDRLLLGKVINAGDLGKYVIGANLAAIPMTIYWRIQLGVAHPLYARIRHDPPDILRSKLRRLRLGIVSTLGP
ncbi:MAG: oligosaccharide flippase family protein, partial [Planctomycetales bacterium]|nr:oligosaccharide flippase family protein [Planctomycetales bacterium]